MGLVVGVRGSFLLEQGLVSLALQKTPPKTQTHSQAFSGATITVTVVWTSGARRMVTS
jgi:hypothetical protein